MHDMPHNTADILEFWNNETNTVGYYVEFDGVRQDQSAPPQPHFKRRCDASRYAHKQAPVVNHWYVM